MNEFRLFAHGDDFDPDAFWAASSLQFDGVWHKGEKGNNHPQSSGLFKTLGDGATVPICEQESIAIEYLSANKQALRELARHPQVRIFILGLQYHFKYEPSIAAICMGPPTPLMSLCVDIGIEPVYYVTFHPPRRRGARR